LETAGCRLVIIKKKKKKRERERERKEGRKAERKKQQQHFVKLRPINYCFSKCTDIVALRRVREELFYTFCFIVFILLKRYREEGGYYFESDRCMLTLL